MIFSKSAGLCKHFNNAAGEPFHYLLKVPRTQHLSVSVMLPALDQTEHTLLFLPRTRPLYGCTSLLTCSSVRPLWVVCSSGRPGGLELSVLGGVVEVLADSCAALPSIAEKRLGDEVGTGICLVSPHLSLGVPIF